MLVITILTDLKPLVTCFFDFCLQHLDIHLHHSPLLSKETSSFWSMLLLAWASLVTQLVKDAPAMRETWVGSKGW